MLPPGLFDTHAHLDRALEAGDLAALLERAATAGVTHILAVGGPPAANTAALDACARFPDRLAAAVGHDRDQATER
ncbi:MAG: TatD family hydrolase, partial [Candidatus Marinimicrobia bacterium]|nr:TatD family hydrolase [Candidatus Neomarinimicrobiota bacterium]